MNTNLNSYLALILGVATPIISVVVPQIQGAYGSNPYVAAGLAAFMVLWNHFSTPVNAPVPKK